jgi:hypothetical protein
MSIIKPHRPVFSFHAADGVFWFRVCGKGLGFYDRTKRPALYTERNFPQSVWRVGNITVKPLGWKGIK